MAKKLTELNAKFIGAGGPGVFNADMTPAAPRSGVGVVMDCPCGCESQLYVGFLRDSMMSEIELRRLDELLAMTEEKDGSPFTTWETEFLFSLDGRRERKMSDKQADIFDRLVSKHLRGD